MAPPARSPHETRWGAMGPRALLAAAGALRAGHKAVKTGADSTILSAMLVAWEEWKRNAMQCNTVYASGVLVPQLKEK